MTMKWVLIAAGGALGSVLRYAIQGWVQRLTSGSFPLGTLAVNVAGCMLIGFLAAALTGPVLVREEYRIGLTVGILGGFTTFSAFGLETFNLANDGQFRLALANVVLSCGLGFVAVWGGYRLAERWFGV
jgi:CrcB protein